MRNIDLLNLRTLTLRDRFWSIVVILVRVKRVYGKGDTSFLRQYTRDLYLCVQVHVAKCV